jgi:hypothetical protein
MKKILLLIAAALMIGGTAMAKDDVPDYDYELSLVKENVASTSGYKVFKVWSFGKKKEALTQEICMRNAIHGLLFKGLAAGDVGTQGNVPALVPGGYNSHKEYFDAFFGNGEFKQFIQATSRAAQQAGDVVKMGKKYKVGLLVQVNYNALRARLEADHIVEGITDIFKR